MAGGSVPWEVTVWVWVHEDSLSRVILGLSGGTPASRHPVLAPGKGWLGGKASPAGPGPRTGPGRAGRLAQPPSSGRQRPATQTQPPDPGTSHPGG